MADRGAARPAGALGGLAAGLTSFLGRQVEAERLTDLLAEHRLVTVTGPGGVGKTRLALEVCEGVRSRFRDDVIVVDLSELRATAGQDDVLIRVLAATGLQVVPGDQAAESGELALTGRHSLLVLDNCEQITLLVGGFVSWLLGVTTDVRVLVTSRQPMAHPAEAQLALSPLSFDDPVEPTSLEAPAIELFWDRLAQAGGTVSRDGRLTAAVRDIVTVVDGLPLGVELAASTARLIGVLETAELLYDQPSLHLGAPRSVPPRHQSLTATIDWSYSLLTLAQRLGLARLAVIPGSFSLAAAQHILDMGDLAAGTDRSDPGVPASLAVLTDLVQQSLVAVTLSPRLQQRYRLLVTVRSYARERRPETGQAEEHEVLRRLAGWAAERAVQLAEQLARAGDPKVEREILANFDDEAETFSGCWQWACEHDLTIAIRLGVALTEWRGRRGQDARNGEEVARCLEFGAQGSEQVRCMLTLSGAAIKATDFQLGVDWADRGVRLAVGLDEPALLMKALIGLSAAQRNAGDLVSAGETAERAFAHAQKTSNDRGRRDALAEQSAVATYAADYVRGQELAQSALAGDLQVPPVRPLQALVAAASQLEEHDVVAAACWQGLEVTRGTWVGPHIFFHAPLAMCEAAAGRFPEAVKLAVKGLTLAAGYGDRMGYENALSAIAEIAGRMGEPRIGAVLYGAVDALPTGRRGLIFTPGTANLENKQRLSVVLGAQPLAEALEEGARLSRAQVHGLIDQLVSLSARAPDASLHQRASARSGLTEREEELLTVLAEGRTDAEIARQLFISIRTVRSHLDRIRGKTGARRRVELARLIKPISSND